jgi:hypothetical protein
VTVLEHKVGLAVTSAYSLEWLHGYLRGMLV